MSWGKENDRGERKREEIEYTNDNLHKKNFGKCNKGQFEGKRNRAALASARYYTYGFGLRIQQKGNGRDYREYLAKKKKKRGEERKRCKDPEISRGVISGRTMCRDLGVGQRHTSFKL